MLMCVKDVYILTQNKTHKETNKNKQIHTYIFFGIYIYICISIGRNQRKTPNS